MAHTIRNFVPHGYARQCLMPVRASAAVIDLGSLFAHILAYVYLCGYGLSSVLTSDV